MFNPILDMFLNMPKQAIKINGVDSDGIINEIKDKEVGRDEKYLFALKDVVTQGDIIEYDDKKYIITLKEQPTQTVYDRCIIRQANHRIIFNQAGTHIIKDSIIEDVGQGVESNQFISYGGGKIIVYVNQDNMQTITMEQRFIVMGRAWKITGYTTTENGILKIYADKDIFNPDDDRENAIADRWKYETKTVITLATNVETISLSANSSYTIIATVKENDVVVENPIITYTSDNMEVATIDNGVVTGISIGNANVTLSYNGVSKTIPVEVTQSDTITFALVGKDKLYVGGNTGTYEVKKYVNGTETNNDNIYTFIIDRMDNVNITATTATSITISTNYEIDDIVITATNTNNNQDIYTKAVMIRGF